MDAQRRGRLVGPWYGYPSRVSWGGRGRQFQPLREMYWAQGPLICHPASPCPYARTTDFASLAKYLLPLKGIPLFLQYALDAKNEPHANSSISPHFQVNISC